MAFAFLKSLHKLLFELVVKPGMDPSGKVLEEQNNHVGQLYHAPDSTHPVNAVQAQADSSQSDEDRGRRESTLKCSKFLKTLLHLSHNNSHQPGPVDQAKFDKVKRLVQDMISGRLVPENFTSGLQEVLGSQAQPRLVPFLKQALPCLRQALLEGSVTIDGIDLNQCAGPDFQPPRSEPAPSEHVQQVPASYPSNAQSVGPEPSFPDNQQYDFPRPNNQEIIYQPVQPMMVPQGVTVVNSDPISIPDNAVFVDEHGNPIDRSRLAQAQLLPDNLPATLLDTKALFNRLFEQMGGDIQGVDPEVFVRISECVESRLRDLLKQLSSIAEHRLEPLRMNPMYTQVNEPRRQLRFIEEMEKQAFVRRQNIEREAWIKYSKSKTKDKDTVQKAKEIQRASQEENMNREANEAAIAALGGSRGIKRTWGSTDPMKSTSSAGLSLQTQRPRIRRVTMKDFLCALNGKGVQRNSVIKFLVAYGLVELSEQQQSSTDAN